MYHPERFDYSVQLLCRNGLTGRCYWEIEEKGMVYTAVTYRGIGRRGTGNDCIFGGNEKSWCLYKYSDCLLWHNNTSRLICNPGKESNRLAVYLDWPAGILSFYTVSSDTLTHIHTVHSRFTEPVYPGFGFKFTLYPGMRISVLNSYVSLNQNQKK